MPATEPSFLFFVDWFFLQNEMYCNLCLVSGNVSGFFSSDRDFFLVFKYVKLYMFSLKKIAKFFIFYWI